MKARYKNKNIYYLGNVINSLYEMKDADGDMLNKKSKSSSLLFIGNKKYVEGAQCLVDAFDVLKKTYPDLSLNIIGIAKTEIVGGLNEGVNCYGYLDKGKETDRKLYYSLLQEAKIFVNTAPNWGAFSASLEAMYFYTPVILTAYKEFVETFGMRISFGYYCENNSVDLLCAKIDNLLNHPSYSALCINAHESVKKFTWDVYINKMLEVIKEKLSPDLPVVG